jgi:hypothetical protein
MRDEARISSTSEISEPGTSPGAYGSSGGSGAHRRSLLSWSGPWIGLGLGLLVSGSLVWAQPPYSRESFLGLDSYELQANSPALADLDADGDLDMIIGSFDGTLSYLRNISAPGTPRFVPSDHPNGTDPFLGLDLGSYSSPALADLDGDGDLDIMVCTGSNAKYVENIGTPEEPSFVEAQSPANPFFGIECVNSRPDLGDLDGDGDFDLVAGSLDGRLRYFENINSPELPSFFEVPEAANPFAGLHEPGDSYSAPDLVDLDGDGDLDLVVGVERPNFQKDGDLRYFENIGTATAPEFVRAAGGDNPLRNVDALLDLLYSYKSRVPEVADMDDDGDLDIIIGTDVLEYFPRTCPGEVCLSGDRFEVAVEWRDFDGNTGVGRSMAFSSEDSAVLWFFEPDNWELLVKIVDGCTYNDHFWVLASAATNVEYTLRVTDTTTQVAMEYHNPLGQRAQAFTDTNAFASCP